MRGRPKAEREPEVRVAALRAIPARPHYPVDLPQAGPRDTSAVTVLQLSELRFGANRTGIARGELRFDVRGVDTSALSELT